MGLFLSRGSFKEATVPAIRSETAQNGEVDGRAEAGAAEQSVTENAAAETEAQRLAEQQATAQKQQEEEAEHLAAQQNAAEKDAAEAEQMAVDKTEAKAVPLPSDAPSTTMMKIAVGLNAREIAVDIEWNASFDSVLEHIHLASGAPAGTIVRLSADGSIINSVDALLSAHAQAATVCATLVVAVSAIRAQIVIEADHLKLGIGDERSVLEKITQLYQDLECAESDKESSALSRTVSQAADYQRFAGRWLIRDPRRDYGFHYEFESPKAGILRGTHGREGDTTGRIVGDRVSFTVNKAWMEAKLVYRGGRWSMVDGEWWKLDEGKKTKPQGRPFIGIYGE